MDKISEVLLELHFGNHNYYDDDGNLVEICRIKDRTGQLSEFTGSGDKFGQFDYPVTPLPSTKTTDKSLSTISSERVAEIKQIAADQEKEIIVFWSGGIDSTLALVAFLEAENTTFHVACDLDTAREYPFLYNQIISGVKNNDGVISVKESRAYPISYWSDNYIIVTGELGDQLVGTMNYFTTTVTTDFNEALETVIDDNIMRTDLLDNWRDVVSDDLITDELEASLAQCSFEITTVADFLWWFNFTLKYHLVEHRFYTNMKNPSPNTEISESGVYQHFFAGETWQQWAMSNRQENIEFITENNPYKYKQSFKDYIADYTGDEQYRLYKQKGLSDGGRASALHKYYELETY